MTCPYNNNPLEEGATNGEGLDYSSYLNVGKLLSCTSPQTNHHDEHLFIGTFNMFILATFYRYIQYVYMFPPPPPF